MRPVTFLLLLHAFAAQAQYLSVHHAQGLADMLVEYLAVKYPQEDIDADILYVSVQRQRMYHIRGHRMLSEYVISTSAKGLGGEQNSERTPEGAHRIVERIGQGVPAGGVFRERAFTGEHAGAEPVDEDLITSRILWLGGLEPGVNQGGTVDSRTRAIYIHGTPDAASLGRPSSHGCIRLSDADMIALFDEVPLGTLVVILDN